eukprot:gnl/MRDRNA2_/MRDRNA2_69672_c0_seq1.p1 gnl/MRDRNA2_/MRDRNA2_69672_c0~~gnl/MRDRNA2_/MRDRNA2_69672_c0_seq1.p1  ORF type:complete len:727 (+),score=108.48 gnl/MRDRNA2_/MRDRNA2_69672_c0_seq1:100-2280(+)
MNGYGAYMGGGSAVGMQQLAPLAGRGVDIILVLPYKTSAHVRYGDEQNAVSRTLIPPDKNELTQMQAWEKKREEILRSLVASGLHIVPFYSRDRDEVFVKVGIDVQKLREVAEMLQHKIMLKAEYLNAYADYKADYSGRKELGYKDRRILSHLYQPHLDPGEKTQYPRPDAIFRTVDRVHLIDHVIRSKDEGCAGVDTGGLLHDGNLLHYFPLHENRLLAQFEKHWFLAFVTGGKIDDVRNYFGERIALYFLFMSYFSTWLVLPSMVGLGLWVFTIFYQTPDNFASIPFCFFMILCCTLFTPFWKRRCARAAVAWGTLNLQKKLEPSRPEFYGTSRINPVTERVDKFYPWSQRVWKVFFSYTVITVTVLCLSFVVSMLFFLRHLTAGSGGRFLFQCINAIVVEILNDVFTTVARVLTDHENHRTESEYASHLLAKTVVFKFINSYISLYYIAFFKYHSTLFGTPMTCILGPSGQSDCMLDLSQQLGIFIILRLTLQNAIEIGVPYLTMMWRIWREGRQFQASIFSSESAIHLPDMSAAEKQAKMEPYEEFDDMDEILILFGYTTLFAVACPWVPALVLVGVVFECFLDSKKLISIHRRPFPNQARDNEPWDTAFDVFCWLAMATNLAVIVFSSHEFDSWTHWQKMLLFFGMEHAMILTRVICQAILPDVPREVNMLSLKQNAIVHKQTILGGEEEDHEMRQQAMMTSTTGPSVEVFDRDESDEEDG